MGGSSFFWEAVVDWLLSDVSERVDEEGAASLFKGVRTESRAREDSKTTVSKPKIPILMRWQAKAPLNRVVSCR